MSKRPDENGVAGPHRAKETLLLTLSLGIIFLFPPVILIFNKPVTIAGLPLSTIYLFAVWITIIGLCAYASRRLSGTND